MNYKLLKKSFEETLMKHLTSNQKISDRRALELLNDYAEVCMGVERQSQPITKTKPHKGTEDLDKKMIKLLNNERI